MIKVNVLVSDKVKKIVITGHANYDEYGKDIVCSSASSIVITTVNAIITFDESYINYKEEKDKFTIEINKHDDTLEKLITNMLNMLKELENDYPKYIKIKEETL